jgi:hypothetical protein
MTIRVVPWDEQCGSAVEAAFGAAEHWTMMQGRQSWRVPTDGQTWSRCLVVLDDDAEPVAVVSAFRPRLHSGRAWAYLEVSPRRRRAGWGMYALDALHAALPAEAGPLRAKVAGGSPAAGIAHRLGMTPIQRTQEIRVHVPTDLSGAPTQELSVDDPAAVAAWRDWYIGGHDWDPPAPQPDQFWADMVSDADHVLGVPGDERLAGIALVYTEDGRPCFVGGALHRDTDPTGRIAAGLLCSARQVTGDPVHVELDDWMSDVTYVIDQLDHVVLDETFIVADPWQT